VSRFRSSSFGRASYSYRKDDIAAEKRKKFAEGVVADEDPTLPPGAEHLRHT
jgi:hypothetical protein